MVTIGPDGLLATPLPLSLADGPEDGPHGTLLGHFARANPQARPTGGEPAEALAIFMGPDAYISPAWYASKAEHGRVVPTWNYVTLQARGQLTLFDDPVALHALVSRQTRERESGRAEPWQVTDAPAEFVASQLRGIVGFRLRIDLLEGKWKASQNRPEADRAGVRSGLASEESPMRSAMKEPAPGGRPA